MASLADRLLELHSCSSSVASSSSVKRLTTAPKGADCVIVVDGGNMEAAATAQILFHLLLRLLRRGTRCSVPRVLLEGDSVPEDAEAALMICSTGCFRSSSVAEMLLEAKLHADGIDLYERFLIYIYGHRSIDPHLRHTVLHVNAICRISRKGAQSSLSSSSFSSSSFMVFGGGEFC